MTVLNHKLFTSGYLKANKAGLISLATHLLTLAQDEIPAEHHIHYDEFNSLEDGSIELVIQKTD